MADTVRRKKNKTRNLLLLILLAVVSIGAYVLVHHFVGGQGSEEDSEEETSTEELMQVTTEDAVGLTYEYDGKKIVLVKEEDTWKLKGNKEYPVNQDLVAGMLSVFANTDASKTIAKNQDDASEYGLDAPVLTATVEVSDGTKTSITVGMEGIGESSGNYYVTVSGKDGIYMASSDVYTPFQYEEKDLGTIEGTPSISSDTIYGITVNKADTSTFAAVKELEKESDQDDEWTIKAPYASEVAGDAANLSSLASTYTSYSFAQNTGVTKDKAADYGLDHPAYTVTIQYTEEVEEETEAKDSEATASPEATATPAPTKTVKKSFTLFIGSKDSDGNYYVMTSDTKYIYLMSAEDVESYINVDAFSEVSAVVFNEELSNLTEIKVTTPSKTVSYTVASEEEDEELTTLYNAITALSYKGEIEKGAKTGDTVLTLEITYGDSGQYTKRFTFTRQDDSYDQVTADGKTYFVVDSRDVDSVIAAVKTK